MKEVQTLSKLVLVQLHAEVPMPQCFSSFFFKLHLPIRIMAMYMLIQLLQVTEQGARWRPDNDIGYTLLDEIPGSVAVLRQFKVPSVGEVEK